MKALFASLALVLLPVVAHATPPEMATGMEAEVATRIAQGVPAGLAVVDVNVPPGLAAAKGDVAVELRGNLRAGRTSVKVTVTRHGKSVKTGWAMVQLEAMRPVLVARRPLVSGDALDAGAVAVEQRAVPAGNACDLPASALAGAHIRASVDAGGIVSCAVIERAAPVGRGTPVRVVVKRGNVQIVAQATLETSARPGESAQARLEGSQRLVRGRLADAGTLVMEAE